jgi:hypothetical protein
VFITSISPLFHNFKIYPQAKPGNEGERINDEIKRQASKCTCNQQFLIHKIGEGKYRVCPLFISLSFDKRFSVLSSLVNRRSCA